MCKQHLLQVTEALRVWRAGRATIFPETALANPKRRKNSLAEPFSRFRALRNGQPKAHREMFEDKHRIQAYAIVRLVAANVGSKTLILTGKTSCKWREWWE
jgi:hypothetical protein